MEKKDQELNIGIGYIEQACKDAGVTRTTYYRAKKNIEKGNPLSRHQIKVMSRYNELINDAKESLKAIKGN